MQFSHFLLHTNDTQVKQRDNDESSSRTEQKKNAVAVWTFPYMHGNKCAGNERYIRRKKIYNKKRKSKINKKLQTKRTYRIGGWR